LALAAPLLFIGCGQNGADDNAAALERADEQSAPEAADILRNAADGGGNDLNGLQAHGNAQAAAEAPPQ
jgi:hypothetical protein